jgi:hypothetical protein
MFSIVTAVFTIIFYFLLIINYSVIKKKDIKILSILIFIIGGRFLLASLHEFTFSPLIGGLSLVALHTLASISLLLIVLDKAMFSYRKYLVYYCFLLLMLLSAVVNGTLIISLSDIIKFIYLICISMFFWQSIKSEGITPLSKNILLLIFPVILSQFFGLLVGHSKDTELDYSISYIGSYSHEAVFSIVCLLGVICSSFLYGSTYQHRWILCLFGLFFSIYLANYRTTILAGLPLISSVLYLFTLSKCSGKLRIIVKYIFVVIIGVFIITIINTERFADILKLYNGFNMEMLSPRSYDRESIQLFSGRLYIWSQYYEQYKLGGDLQVILGAGPGYWNTWADKYAHNQFISTLYELGIIGLSLLFYIFIRPFILLWVNGTKDVVLSNLANASQAGLFLLCIGTMPLWSVEGCICLAITLAVFNYFLSSPSNKLRK